MRQLELARLTVGRAGERALLVAEKLGFEQRFRNGRAVDGDKRAVGAWAERVQRTSEQLFARPALALEQHRRIGARRALQRHRYLLQTGILAHDLRRTTPCCEFFLQQDVLSGETALCERTLDQEQQMIRIDRLRKEVERA